MFYLQLATDSGSHGPRHSSLRNRTHLRAATDRPLPQMASRQQRRSTSLPGRQQPQHLRQLHQPDPLRPRFPVDRPHLRRRRQMGVRRQPTNRRAHEPDVRRDPDQRTRIPRNAPQRPESATLRRQNPVQHDPRHRGARSRRRILRRVPLSARPERIRHLQSRVEPGENVLRETGPSLRP